MQGDKFVLRSKSSKTTFSPVLLPTYSICLIKTRKNCGQKSEPKFKPVMASQKYEN